MESFCARMGLKSFEINTFLCFCFFYFRNWCRYATSSTETGVTRCTQYRKPFFSDPPNMDHAYVLGKNIFLPSCWRQLSHFSFFSSIKTFWHLQCEAYHKHSWQVIILLWAQIQNSFRSIRLIIRELWKTWMFPFFLRTKIYDVHIFLISADYCRTRENRICLPKLYIDFDDRQVTINHGASFSTSLVSHLTHWLLETPVLTGSGGSKAALGKSPSRLFHFSCSFLQKIENNKRLTPPPLVLTHPLENPGSATETSWLT